MRYLVLPLTLLLIVGLLLPVVAQAPPTPPTAPMPPAMPSGGAAPPPITIPSGPPSAAPLMGGPAMPSGPLLGAPRPTEPEKHMQVPPALVRERMLERAKQPKGGSEVPVVVMMGDTPFMGQMLGGSIMVPLESSPGRHPLASIGITAAWDANARVITASKGGRTVSMGLGAVLADVSGTRRRVSAPSRILPSDCPTVSGKLFVPLKFVVESLGGSVHYDASKGTVFASP